MLSVAVAHWPQLLHWIVSLILVAGGIDLKIALKKQRRVLTNLKRPIMVIGTHETDMIDQIKLLKECGLFSVTEHRGDKATDFLNSGHRLVVLGYADNDRFTRAFERARSLGIPVLVYAKPNSIVDDGMTTISGYSYASICNTDLRLVSDVFAVMSTMPESK